ncbi:MBOAT family O-acyltransferase [Cellulophaga fucicola]|nr:MBOAT family O-acyltransferase [Cellulophaga fucicola]
MKSEPALVLLLIASTVVDYFCALKIYATDIQRTKKIFAGISIFVNIGILVAFKYLFFFSTSLASLLEFFGISIPLEEAEQSYHISQILLPVGISFYTFQTMSYTIDVYRGNIKPERHLGIFALYVGYFPQLVAGPIERASTLLPQLKKKVTINIKNIEQGLIMMAWGFFLKIVVADRLGIYVDEAYADPESPHGFSLILGAIFFMFQIYYDFSAYTTIAIGTAKILGVDLMQNFNRPIFAKNSSDFWQRWHISLMLWLKDYIYLPLINKVKLNKLTATLIVFFIVGLWHGANWTFVVWSMLNALLIILEVSIVKPSKKALIAKFKFLEFFLNKIHWFFGFAYFLISLVFFRSSSVSSAILYIKSMFNLRSLHINLLNNYLELFLCVLFIIIVQIIHYYKGNDKVYELVLDKPKYRKWLICFAYILVIVLFGINRQNSFIYFQF